MSNSYRRNNGKTRFSLLPQPLVDAEADLYTAGAIKYDDWKWLEVPMDEEETLDSALRHLKKWRAGESFDPETGAHHLTAARWNLGVLFMYEFEGITPPGRRVFKPCGKFVGEQEDAQEAAAEYLNQREMEKNAVSVSVPTLLAGLYHEEVGNGIAPADTPLDRW